MKKDTLPVELEPLIKECLEHGIITRNPAMLELFQQLKKVSETTISILLLGASGTGKELFARAVHALSPRSDKPFVIADLTTIPETLVESELFGHVKGAFTGAESDKKGKFQIADGGTIFLDEIGEMKSELQSKLLRILQEGEFNQVGDNRQIKVNVRIIAATNCDLKNEIKEKRFREDLFYRINGISLNLPRLDERKEDIPLLAHHFVQKYSLEYNKEITGTSELATKQLEEEQWQGNIRELENIIQRAVALSNTEIIQEKDLGLPVSDINNVRGQKTEDRRQKTEGSLNRGDRLSYEEAEDESFLNILRENSFSIDKVKRILKIERGSVSGRFKGICFKVLQECDGNIQKAVQKIAANNGLVKEVESKIYEYRNNLLEKIKSYQNTDQAVEEILKKEKNTKKKYLKYIENFVRKEFYKNS
jgi:transcriptional regulator with GAF, ATPase, and Fis domain